MTITRNLIGSAVADTSNATSYTGPTGSLSANALVLAFVAVTDTGSSDPNTAGHHPTVNNNPWSLGSWTEEAAISLDFGSGNITGLFLFSNSTSSSAGSDSFDIIEDGNDDAYTGALITVVEFTDSGGSVPSLEQVATDTAASGNPIHNTLAALGGASWVEAAFVLDRNPPAGAVDSGWTESVDTGHDTPGRGIWQITSNGVTSDASPSGTWLSSDWIGIAAEIAQPAAASAGGHFGLLGVGN